MLIDHGEDFGITSHGDQARISGTVVHNGACGIYSSGDDCQIDAFASGSPYVNITDAYLGDVLISGSRTTGVRDGDRRVGPVCPLRDRRCRPENRHRCRRRRRPDRDHRHRLPGRRPPAVQLELADRRGHQHGACGTSPGPSPRSPRPGPCCPPSSTASPPSRPGGLIPGCFWAGRSVSQSMTLDVIWYEPFIVYSPITVTALGIDIISAVGRLDRPPQHLLGELGVAARHPAAVRRHDQHRRDRPGATLRPDAGTQPRPVPQGVHRFGHRQHPCRPPRPASMIGSGTDVWTGHIDRMSVAAAYAALPASGTAWTTVTGVTSVGSCTALWMKWTS